jgi:hypothetical protein
MAPVCGLILAFKSKDLVSKLDQTFIFLENVLSVFIGEATNEL